MEFTVTSEFSNNVDFDKGYLFEDYINKFQEIMPQIIFDSEKNIIYTVKEYYEIIGKHSHAYGYTAPPDRLFQLIQNPNELRNLEGILDNSLRHQGSIYPQTYYWIIFIIELLNRCDDAIVSSNTNITLNCQLFYEYYVIDALIQYYSINLEPSFYDYDIMNALPELDIKKTEVSKKMINLVEENLVKLKNTLIEKCKKNEITPIRVLWLYACELSYDEVNDILNNTNNKYIRASLFWVAGFKELDLIKDNCKNELEKESFKSGYDIKINYKNRKIKEDCNYNKIIKDNLIETKIVYNYNYMYRYGFYENDNELYYGFDGTNQDYEKSDTVNDYYNNHKNENYKKRKELFKYLNENLKIDINEFHEKFFSGVNCGNKHLLTFHPFYTFQYGLGVLNWHSGIYTDNINCEYKNIAEEYTSYYNNNDTDMHYYLCKHENTSYFFYDGQLIIN